MTIEEATDVAREYFKKQGLESGLVSYFTFRVNGAIQKDDGVILIWCSHSFAFTVQHHRIGLDSSTGRIIVVQKQETDQVQTD